MAQRWHTGEIDPAPQRVLVFASNLAAKHTRSYAKQAIARFGAGHMLTDGPHGMAYAIPIKNATLQLLPIDQIAWSVRAMFSYAQNNPDLEFWVGRFGVDCVALTDSRMAPLFKGRPSNCVLPTEWQAFMNADI